MSDYLEFAGYILQDMAINLIAFYKTIPPFVQITVIGALFLIFAVPCLFKEGEDE